MEGASQPVTRSFKADIRIEAKAPQAKRDGRARLTHRIAVLFPCQGEWTEGDYLALPDTNRIVELSQGRLVIPDMPTTTHQRALRNLLRAVDAHVMKHGLGEVCPAPLRVRLWEGKLREPDIVFMSAAHADRIEEDFWGVPDLVAEVISPRTEHSSGTERLDRVEKFKEYARAGVSEYWLVDPKARAIEVYLLREGAYHLFGKWEMGETARSEILPGFEVPVAAILPEE
jgi:Uma2 family endonuclease